MRCTPEPHPTRVLTHHSFAADLTTVRSVLRTTLADLQSVLPDPARSGDVELVLAEVLNNIVEHAYRGSSKGPVDLSAETCKNGIRFMIADSGRPMPNDSLPTGARTELNCAFADLPEGGFGWILVRELAQDLQYRRENGINYTSFQIVT